jgi:hypothetical protein
VGQSAIRAIHVATDGTVPDPMPIEIAASSVNAPVAVAATPARTLIAFTRNEAVGTSVRAVLLGR